MNREETIRRIHEDLQQLPEEYVAIVSGVVERLRAQLMNDNALKRPDQPEAPPFVDEIERVQEQSGRGDDQHFA
jgi:hypothetical protein